VGFSAGGISAVGFIVKIGAINQNAALSISLCQSQRTAASGGIVLPDLSLRCMVLGCLLGTGNCNSDHHLFRLRTPRHYQLTTTLLLQSP
jgi:hypothetical protein